MKNSIFIFLLLVSSLLVAQVPQKFNYQGVARTEQGDPIKNQNLKLKIAVLPTEDATVSEYEEIQSVKTNEFGLYSLQIGNGEAVLGDMKTVKWETGNKYIRVAIDPKGGNDFTVIGTSQLLSVPYAIYADKAGQARETVGGHTGDTRSGAVSTSATGTGTVNYLTKFTAANTIYNSQIFDNGTNIGIGTTSPQSRMHITTSAGNQEHLRMENLSSTSWGKFIFYNDINANYHTFTKYGSAVPGYYGGASTLFPYANLMVFGSNNSPTVMANGHNIGFATVNGGTAYFKFIGMQSTGNVGLGGNSTPATSIHINRTDATGDTVKITNNTTGHTATDGLDIRTTGNVAEIINRENNVLNLGSNNATALTIDAANNIGVGTTTPSSKLEVNGQVKINGGIPGTNKVLTSDATGLASWQTITNAMLSPWQISGNDMYNTNTGNIGIGTITPLMQLHLAKSNDKNLLLENNAILAAGKKSGMFFKTTNYYTGAIKTIGVSTAGARMGFYVGVNANDSLLQERVTINNSGYVGINDTSPSYPLDVNGSINTTGSINASGSVYNTYQQNYGDSYVDGYFDVDGNVDFGSSLHVAGNTTNDGSMSVGGEMTVSSGQGIVKSNSSTQLRMGFTSGSISSTSLGVGGSLTATFNVTPFTGNNTNIRVSVAQFQPSSGTGYLQCIFTPHDVDAASNTVQVTWYNAGTTSATFSGTLYLLCVATD